MTKKLSIIKRAFTFLKEKFINGLNFFLYLKWSDFSWVLLDLGEVDSSEANQVKKILLFSLANNFYPQNCLVNIY